MTHPARPSPLETEVLLPEANRRARRRRVLLASALVIVVLAALVALVAAGLPPIGSRTTRHSGTTVTVALPTASAIHVPGELDALSCPTSTSCWAVGTHYGPKNREVA